MVIVPAEGRAGAVNMRDLLRHQVVGDPINRDERVILPGRAGSVTSI
jgi:uncharacterized spore protein YtfJ